jgi:hypothetical protein
MAPPFLVVGFPRSRTAWLAALLECAHEPSLHWSSIDDLRAALVPGWGACDSLMTLLAADARALCADMSLVVVRRPRAEVEGSFARKGLRVAPFVLDVIERKLAEIECDFSPLVVRYDELDDEAIVAGLYAWCRGRPMDRARWRDLRHRTIERDIGEALRLLERPQLADLFGASWGTAIGWESVDDALSGGMREMTERNWQEAAHDHADVPLAVDWDGYRALEKAGAFRLLTARRRGALVGWASFYLSMPLQFSTTFHAYCDSLYVERGHRGIAPWIVTTAERELAKLAPSWSSCVRVVYFAPSDRIERLMQLLRYERTESVWRKVVPRAA